MKELKQIVRNGAAEAGRILSREKAAAENREKQNIEQPMAAEQAAPLPEADTDRAARTLSRLVQIPTVSFPDRIGEDEEAFLQLEQLLEERFPRVHRTCTKILPGPRSLLFHWKGRSSETPTVLLAHYDVVPVTPADWDRDPFSGALEDGRVWGRGSLDDKCCLTAILQNAEQMIAEGFVPKQDVFLAFSGSEEVSGCGAPDIAAWMQSHGIRPAVVLDEGGNFTSTPMSGVTLPCAMVGIAEKGVLNVELSVQSTGGHAAQPPRDTPIELLAHAVTGIEKHPFPFRIIAPVRHQLQQLAEYMEEKQKKQLADPEKNSAALERRARREGGELEAMFRTTCAFTRMQGSDALNALPRTASICMNLRLLPGDTVQTALRHLEKAVGDPRVQLRVIGTPSDPSPISRTDGEPWERLNTAIRRMKPESLVCPFLLRACTDSRHYSGICPRVYKFSPLELTAEEGATVHGINESVRLETLTQCLQFYRIFLELS